MRSNFDCAIDNASAESGFCVWTYYAFSRIVLKKKQELFKWFYEAMKPQQLHFLTLESIVAFCCCKRFWNAWLGLHSVTASGTPKSYQYARKVSTKSDGSSHPYFFRGGPAKLILFSLNRYFAKKFASEANGSSVHRRTLRCISTLNDVTLCLLLFGYQWWSQQ